MYMGSACILKQNISHISFAVTKTTFTEKLRGDWNRPMQAMIHIRIICRPVFFLECKWDFRFSRHWVFLLRFYGTWIMRHLYQRFGGVCSLHLLGYTVGSSKTLVHFCQTALRHIQEYRNIKDVKLKICKTNIFSFVLCDVGNLVSHPTRSA
jgi:hypothetical protein